MRLYLQPLILAVFALAGCHSTLEAPEDMTVERAREIIERFNRDRAPFDGAIYKFGLPGFEGQGQVPAKVVYKGKRVDWFPLAANDTFFQRGKRTGENLSYSVEREGVTLTYTYPLMNVIDTDYADLGEFWTSYSSLNVMTPFTAFVIGPTMIQPYYGRDPNNPMVAPADMSWIMQEWTLKNKLMSFVPLWLVGLPFWVKTDEQEFAEALMFMKARLDQL